MEMEKKEEKETEILKEFKRITEIYGTDAILEALDSLYKEGLIVFRNREGLLFCSCPVLTQSGEKLVKTKI